MPDPLVQEALDQALAELRKVLDIPPEVNGEPLTAAETRLIDVFRKIPPERRPEWIRLGMRMRKYLP